MPLFKVTLMGVTKIVQAATRNKAKYRMLKAAGEAGYRVEFSDAKVERVKSGAELIADERKAQEIVYSNDAVYKDSQLVRAAVCYALLCEEAPTHDHGQYSNNPGIPVAWPWEDRFWKPKDNLRNLQRAGALIAAEIDRLLVKGGDL